MRLALQRFHACEITAATSEHFPRPPEIKDEALGFFADEEFEATVRFAPEAADFVAERVWSENQKLEKAEDESVTLTLKIANFREGLSWILGFGSRAIVLSPLWFAREVRKELRQATRNYRAKRDSSAGEINETLTREEEDQKGETKKIDE